MKLRWQVKQDGHPAIASRKNESQASISKLALVDWIETSERWMMIVLTAVIALGGGISAFIFWRQLAAMQGQLDEMRLDSRPWISAETFTMVAPLEIREDGGDTRFVIQIKNVGKLPAVRIGIDGLLLIRNIQDVLERQKSFCNAIRESLKSTRNNPRVLEPGRTVFPDKSASFEIWASFMPDDYKRYRDWLGRIPGPAALPTVVGCVHYEFPRQEGYHFSCPSI